MAEIKISINIADPTDPHRVQFQSLLDEFRQQSRASVTVQIYNWGAAWAEFTKTIQYGIGPVVSQSGDSWMGSLISHNSLRIFKEKELAQLNGRENFLESSWQSCLSFNDKDVVAIPWVLDTCLVYFHRDMLEKAGVDPATAFLTFESFHQTLEKLQAAGFAYPLGISTNWSHSNVHLLTSWVWGSGGDFTNPEKTKVEMNQPGTREGMNKYFSLFPFIPPDMQPLTDQDCLGLFLDRKIAITIRNPTLLFRLKKQEFPETFAQHVGIATVPGVPWIGGSHLIIWKHIRPDQEPDAFSLIQFLTSKHAAMTTFESTGLIPANLEALSQIDHESSIFAPAFQSVKTGRVLPRLRIWGVAEERIALAMMQIWGALFRNPHLNIDQVVMDNIDPMVVKINMMSGQ